MATPAGTWSRGEFTAHLHEGHRRHGQQRLRDHARNAGRAACLPGSRGRPEETRRYWSSSPTLLTNCPRRPASSSDRSSRRSILRQLDAMHSISLMPQYRLHTTSSQTRRRAACLPAAAAPAAPSDSTATKASYAETRPVAAWRHPGSRARSSQADFRPALRFAQEGRLQGGPGRFRRISGHSPPCLWRSRGPAMAALGPRSGHA